MFLGKGNNQREATRQKPACNYGFTEIRFLDINKTVQRPPYRLSENEKQIVRDKIQQMIEANEV